MDATERAFARAGLSFVADGGMYYVYAASGKYLGSVNPECVTAAGTSASVYAGKYFGMCGTWGRVARVFAAVRDGGALPEGFLTKHPPVPKAPPKKRKAKPRKKVA